MKLILIYDDDFSQKVACIEYESIEALKEEITSQVNKELKRYDEWVKKSLDVFMSKHLIINGKNICHLFSFVYNLQSPQKRNIGINIKELNEWFDEEERYYKKEVDYFYDVESKF